MGRPLIGADPVRQRAGLEPQDTDTRDAPAPGLLRYAVVGLVAVGLSAGCGSTQADPGEAIGPGTAVLAPGDQEPDLTCTSDERVSGSFSIAADAKGARTARAAVTEFAAGEPAVVSSGGSKAWILRPDGTATTRLDLFERDGWFVYETLGC